MLAGAGAATIAARPLLASAADAVASLPALPDKASFAPLHGTYLDSGTMHPVPLGAQASVKAYLEQRGTMNGYWQTDDVEARVKGNFARLINADPAEIALVQSTTAGEQAIIDALGLNGGLGAPRKSRIVTDTLHFFGSFYLYEELAQKGVDVAWVRPRTDKDGTRIAIEDMEKAITPGTTLVVLSLVSTYNGFEHDLKRVCEIAHAKGALVYADIVHAAGAVPVDVRATNVDFAACASYKWLMGDFGLGFLYVRADLHDRLNRTRFGYYQLDGFDPHVYPLDAPAHDPRYPIADVTPRKDMEGLFAGGTFPHTILAALDYSLDHLVKIGVDRLTAARRPLMARLHAGLTEKGYSVVTPPDSRTPLITCVLEDARGRIAAPLKAAGVQITVSKNRFRVSPSVFNDMADIERLLDVLPPA
ncbi:aminotransferase class V-fold PLP-dependent enzyme [Novosphingobium sp. 9]|uniref:aminotransferase class V-fold PLP-dependent enzyme n=1 Tax=Novosphingobium sp. 9 TaxID=2025349 RepID=UPI0021B6D7DE|nr:aminotransferase class V-fold PLP-dependent enzyme [Novosphingobium sp. 9]